jgi:hypothetical protein
MPDNTIRERAREFFHTHIDQYMNDEVIFGVMAEAYLSREVTT